MKLAVALALVAAFYFDPDLGLLALWVLSVVNLVLAMRHGRRAASGASASPLSD